MRKHIRTMSDLERYLADHPYDAAELRKREPLVKLASALIELRAALGLSQEAFAERADLLPSQLSEYENAATSGITLQTLVRIAGAAGAGLRIYFNMRDDNCSFHCGTISPIVARSWDKSYVAKSSHRPTPEESIAV